jgi:alkylation response protein AidB-like acyl-CoA dehydrogenase
MTALDAAEVEELRASTRAALEDLSPSSRVRELMATERGWEVAEWTRACAQLGTAGIAVPEPDGGSGLSIAEAGMLFEEAGRVLWCAPLMSVTGLALPLLLALDDRHQLERLLPGLLSGESIVTVLTCDSAGRAIPEVTAVTAATAADGSARLTGSSGFVVDGASAELFLVPAATEEGLGVFAVRSGDSGVRVTPLVTLDQTRKQARVELDGARGEQVGAGDATEAVVRAFAVSQALLACELAAVAARSLELTVDYVKQRVQFGRAIGSFQAVKQKASDMLIKVESAKSAAYAAARAAATGDEEFAVIASVASAYCAEAAVAVTADAIQLHGGIGFTWEHDAHLYFKRALAGEQMLGSPSEHYDRVAEHLAATVDG